MADSLNTLDYAILAMDVYNTQDNQLLPAGPITSISVLGYSDGFGAKVYNIGGTFVISYLGTNGNDLQGDIISGWPLTDSTVASQVVDAAKLYQSVAEAELTQRRL
jgi:hypothetical protein